MGIQERAILLHWNYFLALEEDVVRLSRYLEPTESNFNAYSLELARILFAAASEVDVVAKQLCKKLNSKSKARVITEYRKDIVGAYPQLPSAIVDISRFGLTLTPWDQWENGESPIWWRAYNNVKHQRHTHFAEASLKNTLNAVSGLFVLLLFFYREEARHGQLAPDPGLFRIGYPFHVDRSMWGVDTNLYQLIE